jgi:DHA1 family tetracycline resistance protein-like MFS transporter
MTRHVSATEQGELQGAIGSVRGIAMIAGPAFFTLLFAWVSELGIYPLVGAPWFCGALLLVGAAVLAQRSMRSTEPVAEAIA